jgi:predicted  nucleic acid-binding Zn-ribbon protein
LIGEVAKEEQIKSLLKQVQSYKDSLQTYQEKESKISQFKESKVGNCRDCQKYCNKHEKETQTKMAEHQSCSHCNKHEKEIGKLKEQIESFEEKLGKLKNSNNQTKNNKEINKLSNELAKKKERKKELHREAFSLRVRCPKLNKIKEARKNCQDCQKQTQKKYSTEIQNPLKRAFLINEKKENPEIYLLAKEDVC